MFFRTPAEPTQGECLVASLSPVVGFRRVAKLVWYWTYSLIGGGEEGLTSERNGAEEGRTMEVGLGQSDGVPR